VVSSNYTVRLREVFQGPLDLLLHLVREQEVEIHEVEISKVIEGYLAYLKDLKDLDIELAGEFLVMAATLMAIKSRSLLPRDAVDLEEDLDPRDELIQRLIEYRRFKEAGDNLYERFEERVQIYPRGPQDELAGTKPEPTIDLGELTTWDLLATFSRLMRETLANRPHHIKTDPRPLRFYVERMANLVRDVGNVSLRAIAEADEAPSRESMIGSFCALLEMCRLGLIEVTQDDIDSDIMIQLRPEHRTDLDEVVSGSSFDDEVVAEADEAEEDSGGDAEESDSEAGGAPADTPPEAVEQAASEPLVESHETPKAPRASEQGES
jgi:segregation and condensation protein A